jgi:hypothetical protein
MSQSVADRVRGLCGVIAVSDVYRLAPWADALVSQDGAWWKHHTPEFAGRKFGGPRTELKGIERVEPGGIIASSTNSGLLACHVAMTVFHAKRILLLGVDMRGTHFFGPHPKPLNNTSEPRFDLMKKQFAKWSHRGVEVLNCTPGSGLTCFPSADLETVLAGLAESSLHAA